LISGSSFPSFSAIASREGNEVLACRLLRYSSLMLEERAQKLGFPSSCSSASPSIPAFHLLPTFLLSPGIYTPSAAHCRILSDFVLVDPATTMVVFHCFAFSSLLKLRDGKGGKLALAKTSVSANDACWTGTVYCNNNFLCPAFCSQPQNFFPVVPMSGHIAG
jgi:hypothetical protein